MGERRSLAAQVAWCDGFIEGSIAMGYLLTADTTNRRGEEWDAMRDEYLEKKSVILTALKHPTNDRSAGG